VWEAVGGGERCRLRGDRGRHAAVAFSPDGRLLAAAGAGGAVRVWQVAGGREVRPFTGHEGPVTALAFAAGGKLLSVSADGTALIWDTSGLKWDTKPPAGKIDADAAWEALGGGDAGKAYETIVRLGAAPDVAVRLLRERLKPVEAADGKRIERLIAQLDDDEFTVREQASQELAKLGSRAEEALRKTAQAAPSEEVRQRVAELLRKLDGGSASGEPLRETRALEVLEGLGTPEAKKLLEELAKGAPEAALTREAKASLERLAKRP
jgi:hypothetical protein